MPRGKIPATPVSIVLACVIGVLGGYGAIFFTYLIDFVTNTTVRPIMALCDENRAWLLALVCVPAAGLWVVSWFTRRFAPEAQGHGVPEVITALARNDGIIRARVSVVKILASGVCIGTGGSIGREGPIVQIGSAFGSMFGQWFKLPPRHVKVLVAAGAAAGISATFNAPMAGVIFAGEIILGSFAVESLTPIVISSVLANVVQKHAGEHGFEPVFPQLYQDFQAAWFQLPSYFLLGLLCGLAAVGFTKLLYGVEDLSNRWMPAWWMRALVLGGLLGVAGALYPILPPSAAGNVAWREGIGVEISGARFHRARHVGNVPHEEDGPLPPLFGVGYGVVGHALHLQRSELAPSPEAGRAENNDQIVRLDRKAMLAELWWLLPLALLKPLLTSFTLGGGGSGGIFAPSLFLGATLGASFGIVVNLLAPELSADPGAYAIVGMGAVVAGTTHGTLSAIMIVYEMTGDYRIMLPIMVTAGLAGIVARLVDHESIYIKKLSRRSDMIARVNDMHHLEHVMVRNMMIRNFPTVNQVDDLTEIVRVARANSHVETLPVTNDDGRLVGIIRPEDLHRVLDSDIPPQLIKALDIAVPLPTSISTNANLLEALRDFGAVDLESLPVEESAGATGKVVGLLLRSDVMRRYREEMLRRR